MRKYAFLKKVKNNIKKLMLYESSEGVYLFFYSKENDFSAFGDQYYSTLEEAEAICLTEYNICEQDWILTSDPLEYCQHDIIDPIRIKGRNIGKPQWGRFEKLIDGNWIEVTDLTKI